MTFNYHNKLLKLSGHCCWNLKKSYLAEFLFLSSKKKSYFTKILEKCFNTYFKTVLKVVRVTLNHRSYITTCKSAN